MMTTPGPRDWLPPEPSKPRRARARPLIRDPRCWAPPPLLFAALSVLFGAFAVAIAVGPWLTVGYGSRFVVSTVGLTAISFGVHAIRRTRHNASPATRALSSFGIATGAVATLVMLATLITFQPSPGVAQAAPATIAVGPAPPVPTRQAPPTLPALGSMEQTVGTLAYVMKQEHRAGSSWPPVLEVSGNGSVTAPGVPRVLVRLPAGTRLGYRTSTDGTAYAVRLSTTADPALYVDYDTNSGVVTASR